MRSSRMIPNGCSSRAFSGREAIVSGSSKVGRCWGMTGPMLEGADVEGDSLADATSARKWVASAWRSTVEVGGRLTPRWRSGARVRNGQRLPARERHRALRRASGAPAAHARGVRERVVGAPRSTDLQSEDERPRLSPDECRMHACVTGDLCQLRCRKSSIFIALTPGWPPSCS